MRIGEVADAAAVNVQTVRYYERRGLLEEPPRTPGGYRKYEATAVDRIRFIRRARDLGFTLTEVEELLELRVEDEVRRAIRDSGFGAREARVRVRGRIVQEEGVLMLRTPAGERYRLRASEPANLPGPGRQGEVEGQVGADRDETGRWLLEVERSG